MSVFLGLGSNLGDRTEHLENALTALVQHPRLELQKLSTTYESHALLPPNAPSDWDRSYCNLVAMLKTDLEPAELLAVTQDIERRLGRCQAETWAPRIIDIDIILCGERVVATDHLHVPHRQAANRPFVLSPLAEIAPGLEFPGTGKTVLQLHRALSANLPAWMAVVNVTPDSFANESQRFNPATLKDWALPEANYIDIGAESTRPGAEPIAPMKEWQRLSPMLRHVQDAFGDRRVKPKISIDTRNVETASRALEAGVDVINDVTGLADPAMVERLAAADCDVVVMHSLSVPADPHLNLPPAADPVRWVLEWCDAKLESLERHGLSIDRIIVDPGVGFGKSASQSLQLIRRADEFTALPCRILFGHSRKSYLKTVTTLPPQDRDIETLAVSARLIDRNVDILRVHNVEAHRRFYRAISKI